MPTFIAPATLQAAWSAAIPDAIVPHIPGTAKYARAQGGVAHWCIEEDETLLLVAEGKPRVIAMKDGVVIAFGDADPKGAKWKAHRGIAFPVKEGKMAVFSSEAPADGPTFELAPGRYSVVSAPDMVRLKRGE